MATFYKFLLLVTLFSKISSDCVENYKTVCDKIADIKKYRTDSWGELVIGNLNFIKEIPENKENTPVPALNEKFFGNVANVYSLTIINQINTVWMEHDYPGLVYINLYKNNLRKLSLHSFTHFVHLKTLILKDNDIVTFLSDFSSNSVKVLDLSRNKLEFLKPKLFLNSTLRWISLKSNELTIVGEKPFPASLKILNLDFNKLTYFGEEAMENLEKLEELTLSNNKIRSMPQLKYLKNLRFVDLSRNAITVLVDNFGGLKNLTYLDLSSNRIFKIDRWDLAHNTYINIRVSLAFNRLPYFGYEEIIALFGHPKLITNNTLSLYGNPLCCNCLDQMYNYFRMYVIKLTSCDEKFFNNGETPTCLVVGDGGVGDSEVDPEDYQKFINGILKGEKNVPCNLVEDFYRDRIAFVPRKNVFD